LLRARYASRAVQKLTAEELLQFDRHFYASWPAREDIRVIGLDSSRSAVEYAERAGAIDIGIVADLESGELPRDASEKLKKVDLVMSTGCVGYVTRKTFEKLIACVGDREAPWIASFVLRMFDYEGIAQTLARRDLITERFEGATFIQRRFCDSDEMEATLDALEARGIDPAGKESDGFLHADLFVSRPHAEAQTCPINGLISIASGVNRNYGPRLGLRRPFTAQSAGPNAIGHG
jgi:hypothetical protein